MATIITSLALALCLVALGLSPRCDLSRPIGPRRRLRVEVVDQRPAETLKLGPPKGVSSQ